MKLLKKLRQLLPGARKDATVTPAVPPARPLSQSKNTSSKRVVQVDWSAAELLARISELQKANASWPEIWTTLNPDDDAEVQRLLVELRGPHMFIPHVALNALEDACQRAVPPSHQVSRVAMLRAALDRCSRITREG